MKIVHVHSVGNYAIEVEFDDGVKGLIDLSDFVTKGIFSVLKDKHLFSKVYTNGYSIAWTEHLEIDAATIYSELSGKDPSSYLSPKSYASN